MTDKAPESNAVTPSPRRGDSKVVDYQSREWSPGTRGGGHVPADFGWSTNPKQRQEELGTASTEERELAKERFQKR